MELNAKQQKLFQLSILTTQLELEKTFFQLADHDVGSVLVVCDRGTMDPAACEDHLIHSILVVLHMYSVSSCLYENGIGICICIAQVEHHEQFENKTQISGLYNIKH